MRVPVGAGSGANVRAGAAPIGSGLMRSKGNFGLRTAAGTGASVFPGVLEETIKSKVSLAEAAGEGVPKAVRWAARAFVLRWWGRECECRLRRNSCSRAFIGRCALGRD